MEITEYTKGDVVILTVRGRLDALTSPQLDQWCATLLERGVRFLLLDIHGLEYMSSAGIRVLYRTLGEIEGKKGNLVIANAGETIKKVFDMVDLASDIPLYGDLETALKGLRPEGP
ncbi:MAG TPA: STAS domain-containing protein [Syntrophorhabdaceae bacterium]|jgi:anti-anti-sigma factor